MFLTAAVAVKIEDKTYTPIDGYAFNGHVSDHFADEQDQYEVAPNTYAPVDDPWVNQAAPRYWDDHLHYEGPTKVNFWEPKPYKAPAVAWEVPEYLPYIPKYSNNSVDVKKKEVYNTFGDLFTPYDFYKHPDEKPYGDPIYEPETDILHHTKPKRKLTEEEEAELEAEKHNHAGRKERERVDMLPMTRRPHSIAVGKNSSYDLNLYPAISSDHNKDNPGQFIHADPPEDHYRFRPTECPDACAEAAAERDALAAELYLYKIRFGDLLPDDEYFFEEPSYYEYESRVVVPEREQVDYIVTEDVLTPEQEEGLYNEALGVQYTDYYEPLLEIQSTNAETKEVVYEELHNDAYYDAAFADDGYDHYESSDPFAFFDYVLDQGYEKYGPHNDYDDHSSHRGHKRSHKGHGSHGHPHH